REGEKCPATGPVLLRVSRTFSRFPFPLSAFSGTATVPLLNSKKQRPPSPAGRESTRGSGRGRGPGSARRRRWFRLIAIAVPLLNLALLEVLLRVVGYGYSTDFFLPRQLQGRPVFIDNQRFSRRY